MELSIIDKKLAMDSRDIAILTHKLHKNVLKDIREMYSKLGRLKNELTYLDKQGKERPFYLLTYEDTITLLTGYSVELRAAVVKRWLALEKHYQSERKKSIDVRKTFTDELKSRNYTQPHEFIQTTSQMKKALGISHKKDSMTTEELKAVYASEALSSYLLTDEQGYQEVNPVCVEASNIVHKAKKANRR